MSDTEEEWRPVGGYEGYYEVSDWGRVYSLPRRVVTPQGRVRNLNGRMLRPGVGPKGNRNVHLCRDGGEIAPTIASLVLAAFQSKPRQQHAHARHLDGDNGNDRLTNLVYAGE